MLETYGITDRLDRCYESFSRLRELQADYKRSGGKILLQADGIPKNTVGGPAFCGIGPREEDLEAITGPFGVAGRQAGDGQERAALRTKLIKKQSSRLAFSFCCGYPCRRMNEGR